MTVLLSGIRPAAPLVFRAWNGVLADLWQAEIAPGGHGRYRSEAPRIVAVLGEPPSPMHLSWDGAEATEPVRVFYVPAGADVSTRFTGPTALRHLDLHFDPGALGARLAAAGREGAMDRPVCLSDCPVALSIAELLADEIRNGTGDPLTLDSLAYALVGKVFGRAEPISLSARGGLPEWQLAALDRFLRSELHRRVAVAEMAAVVGLSESWFAHAYRQSRGETPHRALQRMRVEAAMTHLSRAEPTLAEVSTMVGFADQAHFTRAFRTITGRTPGAWRKSALQQDCAKADCFSQDIHG
ncbi:AraC-type DNA-binding protein [Palleronia marisminoris]|uniref:Transcriptional activator NphR n=1 Tax=Palleronia marisminoris TaxID=315423 RepID=A0A1Y5RBZ9_9RHOB|nr:AraC family transcriptional regulator [Palleronia marisminoris]SFG11165.1 AraC-type DNA-binding protein [Palleronia marisminoris]SLN13549.1 Transcriptional activator NphR [Palleronia marisminoris]